MSELLNEMKWAMDPVLWYRDVHKFVADDWQGRFLRSNARRIILCCCRQSGKSTIVGKRVAHRLKYRKGWFTVCTAPSERQSLELFQKIREPLAESGEFEEKPVKDNMHELILPNGSRCVCLPSNPDTIRGFSNAKEILVDEAAMVEDAVFAAIEPMMIRSRGAIVYMSTPKGQRGHFHGMWTAGKAWESYLVTYKDALKYGHFLQEDLDRFRDEHGEWMFRQEFGCEFLSTLDAVFPYEQVKASIREDIDTFMW